MQRQARQGSLVLVRTVLERSVARLWRGRGFVGQDRDVTSTARRGQADAGLRVRPLLRRSIVAAPRILIAAERSKGAAHRCREQDGRAAILTVVVRPGGCEWAGSGSSARSPFIGLGEIPPTHSGKRERQPRAAPIASG